MTNYDKYDGKAGGYRGPLAADWLTGDLKKPIGVGINASGQVVKGAGNTGLRGILILTKAYRAGHIVDIMTDGDCTDFPGTSGTNYYADPATGVVNATSAAGKFFVGHTVEADHLIVRFDARPIPA